MAKKPFTFEISLSVLNHLGRNLYRSFITVLGEAVSNSWDADANNVWIYLDKDNNSLFIIDDGDGMNSGDFQNKFLKIGYSKRKKGKTTSDKGRPYIGRKGIGKLALLSCAEKISVISKTKGSSYTGGVIDNSGLDKAITEDLTPKEYRLGEYDLSVFSKYTKNHKKGTIIYIENVKTGINNSSRFLRKLIALYFRFSLLDKSFNIFLDGKKVTFKDLKDLAEKTQFLWNINKLNDPYIKKYVAKLKEGAKDIKMDGDVQGFIASVKTPRYLKITDTDEKIGVDLFVNGRLRERNILRLIPTDRVAISYLYGQVHINSLDDKTDRFTSSREGIIENDPKYGKFLQDLRKKLGAILEQWDELRLKHKERGDPESNRITQKQRASTDLYNVVSDEYSPPDDSENKKKVDIWVQDLADDAIYNFTSYAECFISENLIRKHVQEKKIPLTPQAKTEISQWKTNESQFKNQGNISIEIRKTQKDLDYLGMDGLANLFDKIKDITKAGLSRDAKEYKPIRNALMHTALLTDEAKEKLTAIYKNITGRVKNLLGSK